MTYDQIKGPLSKALLAFVLVTVGVAIGRNMSANMAKPSPAPAPTGGSDKAVVYYLYGTIRCVTCNQVEAVTAKMLQTDFADDLKAGRLEWKQANFQEEEDLAKRYNVAASCVVVSKIRDGKEVSFNRLGDVLIKADKKDELTKYISDAIRAALPEAIAPASSPTSVTTSEVKP